MLQPLKAPKKKVVELDEDDLKAKQKVGTCCSFCRLSRHQLEIRD